MKSNKAIIFGGLFVMFLFIEKTSVGQEGETPHPVTNPESALMLDGEWIPENTHDINFAALPHVPSEHSVVSDVRYAWGWKVNQHNYLEFYDSRFWAMWSDGPGETRSDDPVKHRDIVPGHDRPGQLISYSTSEDGTNWSKPIDLAGPPDDGYGWIARGFWIRDGKLLALATRYYAIGYRGEGLQLHAFEMVPGESADWQHLGIVFDNAMNNFPPKKLPNGEWMMTRRDKEANVYMLVGGTEGFDQWESFPVIGYENEELHAEEPYWLTLPDNNLVAFFRDNKRSGFLYRAFSTNNGRSWTRPVRTNFTDARSKFSGLKLSDGRYVLVSNANPEKRDPLTIAISDDGLVFTKMFYLVGGRHVDYPHVMEHNGNLYVAFASAKQTVEVLKIRITDLDDIEMPPLKEIIKK